jgi:hypothetical protein
VGIAGEIKPACSMPERFRPSLAVAARRFPAVAFVTVTHTWRTALPLNLIEIKVGSPNLCIDFENDHTCPIDVEGRRMFCDFTDDDRYDEWKALVVSAIGGVLVAGLLSAILWLW